MWDTNEVREAECTVWLLCSFSVPCAPAVSLSNSAVCSLIQEQELCQCSHNLMEDVYNRKQTAFIFMMSGTDIQMLSLSKRWCTQLLFLQVQF